MMKLCVGLCGASGIIYGVRLLETLSRLVDVETHLVLSRAALETMKIETNIVISDLIAMADRHYDNMDIGAPIASGTFGCSAMVILPCSMKTLAGIANGYSENLILRAADTIIKERKNLILCPRETPLSAIHLQNMLKLARLGVSIIPPMPAFYTKPKTLDDIIKHHIMKVLDNLGLPYEESIRWNGN